MGLNSSEAGMKQGEIGVKCFHMLTVLVLEYFSGYK